MLESNQNDRDFGEDKGYNIDFYHDQSEGSKRSAQYIVPLVLNYLQPKNVIDVGCGIGTWLSVFKEYGLEILGCDGDYARKLLWIEQEEFRDIDLEKTIRMEKKFDLAITLEVAEHLSAARSDSFVYDLTCLSDFVLFSAAIPGQGGFKHINERFLSYWIMKFRRFGYIPVDCIRPFIWLNKEIEYWYRQNIILFCRKTALVNHSVLMSFYDSEKQNYDLIHPEAYLNQIEKFRMLRNKIAEMKVCKK